MKTCACCGIDKDLSEFSKNRAKKDGLHTVCKLCKRAQQKSWYESHKSEQIARSAKQRQKTLEWVREHKNKPCADCGLSYPYYVMDFDHIHSKEFDLCRGSRSRSIKAIKEEIEKCEVVCSNCHRIRTHMRECNSTGRVADS